MGRKLTSAIAAIALAWVGLSAQGRTEIVEQVLVKVNGEILTMTELEQRQIETIRQRNPQIQASDIKNDALRALTEHHCGPVPTVAAEGVGGAGARMASAAIAPPTTAKTPTTAHDIEAAHDLAIAKCKTMVSLRGEPGYDEAVEEFMAANRAFRMALYEFRSNNPPRIPYDAAI